MTGKSCEAKVGTFLDDILPIFVFGGTYSVILGVACCLIKKAEGLFSRCEKCKDHESSHELKK